MPKSIDDIIPPSRRRMMQENNSAYNPPVQTPTDLASNIPISSVPPPPSHEVFPPINPVPPMPPRVQIRTGRSFPYGTAIIALLVIALSAGALYVFSGAKVEITPTTQEAQVTGEFTASTASGTLPYTVVTTQETDSSFVPAEGTQTVNNSAQGTITIMNAQSTKQDLITNTRFETSAGLIFRIHTPVSIPAESTSGSPGTLNVTVYADQPGQQYNIGPSSFTVPGLQNSPSYALVTGKSTGPMTGGFTGTQASVSSSTAENTQNNLQEQLATELQNDLTNKLPSGYVIVPGGTFTSYQALPNNATTSTSVQINEQGTMTAVAFPETALAQAIAYKVAGTYSGEPITLDSVSKLTLVPDIAPGSTTAAADLTANSTFSFSLEGTTLLIWKVDASKIAGAVAGKTRDSAQQILSGLPEVNHAILILRPFWTSTFPSDPSHIQVTVTIPTSSS